MCVIIFKMKLLQSHFFMQNFKLDVSPIESARARFLQIVVDHFIHDHVIEVADSEADYTAQSGQDKLSKRKTGEAQYEGDPEFALPLMYIANMYDSLVNDVNIRLASLNGIREKTIGVALEAAGGLYRRLAKKFPKKGTEMYFSKPAYENWLHCNVDGLLFIFLHKFLIHWYVHQAPFYQDHVHTREENWQLLWKQGQGFQN